MSTTGGTPPGRDADVLRERALRLARPAEGRADGPGGHTLQVLEFVVAGRRCALGLEWLKEVRAARDITPLPFAAPHVLGIVDVRGRVVPVMDLPSLLGFTGERPGPGSIVALGGEAIEAGFVAQDIGGVAQVSRAAVERRSSAMKGLQPEMVHGTTAAGVLVIDGRQLLARIRNASAAGTGRPAN
jgi:purine-binding chemotaxis protein CheW